MEPLRTEFVKSDGDGLGSFSWVYPSAPCFDPRIFSVQQKGEDVKNFDDFLKERAKWCASHDLDLFRELRHYGSTLPISFAQRFADFEITDNIKKALIYLFYFSAINSTRPMNEKRVAISKELGEYAPPDLCAVMLEFLGDENETPEDLDAKTVELISMSDGVNLCDDYASAHLLDCIKQLGRVYCKICDNSPTFHNARSLTKHLKTAEHCEALKKLRGPELYEIAEARGIFRPFYHDINIFTLGEYIQPFFKKRDPKEKAKALEDLRARKYFKDCKPEDSEFLHMLALISGGEFVEPEGDDFRRLKAFFI